MEWLACRGWCLGTLARIGGRLKGGRRMLAVVLAGFAGLVAGAGIV